MNLVQIFEFALIWIYTENSKVNWRPMGRFLPRPSCTVPSWPACTVPGVAHMTSDGAWSRGGGVRPDSGVGRRRGGSGTATRATRWGSNTIGALPEESGSPEKALGGVDDGEGGGRRRRAIGEVCAEKTEKGEAWWPASKKNQRCGAYWCGGGEARPGGAGGMARSDTRGRKRDRQRGFGPGYQDGRVRRGGFGPGERVRRGFGRVTPPDKRARHRPQSHWPESPTR
jgi:hypothetical protein